MEHPDKCQFIGEETRLLYTVAYRLKKYDEMEAKLREVRADHNFARLRATLCDEIEALLKP